MTMLFILGIGFFVLFLHYRWGDYGRDEGKSCGGVCEDVGRGAGAGRDYGFGKP